MKKEARSYKNPEGELVGSGQILVDMTKMSGKVHADLEKISNEHLLPYELYVKDSAKTLGFLLAGYAVTVSSTIWGIKGISNTETGACVASFGILLGLLNTGWLMYEAFDHQFLIGPLLKRSRAKKFFKQVSDELHSDAMNGKVDVKSFYNLMTEFENKKEEAIKRMKDLREKEEETYKERVEKLKRIEEDK